jgi:hypothetical protein
MEMATPQFSRFLFFFLIPMAVHTAAAAVFWEKKEKVKWFFSFLVFAVVLFGSRLDG